MVSGFNYLNKLFKLLIWNSFGRYKKYYLDNWNQEK